MHEIVRTLGALLDVPTIYSAFGAGSHGERLSTAITQGKVLLWDRKHAHLEPEIMEMVERVKALGFTRISSGHYAVVLAHPAFPDKVFKVCTYPDDKYHEFVKYCEGVRSKHIPTIHAKYKGEHSAVYVLDYMRPLQLMNTEFDADEVRSRISRTLDKYWTQPGMHWSCVPRKVESSPMYNRTLMAAARKVAKWVHKNRFSWDLHQGNMMYNPATKAMVITDPIC